MFYIKLYVFEFPQFFKCSSLTFNMPTNAMDISRLGTSEISWNEANQSCFNHQAHLPIVKSFEDLEMLLDFLRVYDGCIDHLTNDRYERWGISRLILFLHKDVGTVSTR